MEETKADPGTIANLRARSGSVVVSSLILGMMPPSPSTVVTPPAQEDEVENLAFLPDRMRHHFAPGCKPAPMNLEVFSETYAEGYGPRETFRSERPYTKAGEEVSFYVHTKGTKAGKTIAHKGPWTAKEVEYARVHGLVLQGRHTRRTTDRVNAINRREAVKRILAGKDIA